MLAQLTACITAYWLSQKQTTYRTKRINTLTEAPSFMLVAVVDPGLVRWTVCVTWPEERHVIGWALVRFWPGSIVYAWVPRMWTANFLTANFLTLNFLMANFEHWIFWWWILKTSNFFDGEFWRHWIFNWFLEFWWAKFRHKKFTYVILMQKKIQSKKFSSF